ncbi:MAG: FHA domain-containing protein [Spirochaetes bacterium]|nr:FHA domain-containing protein [Spirochaetota bacterium]
MNVTVRRIYLCLIGIISGAAVWPFMEMILMKQEKLGSYFFLSIISGLVFGMFIGAFFGSINGIVLKNRFRFFSGILSGAVTGSLAGMLGFLVSQGLIFIAGEFLLKNVKSFNSIGLPVSRALGWAAMGVFIGLGEGIRSGSMLKARVGMLGGLIGGMAGGFALEYIVYFKPDFYLARFAGFMIFGLLLGFFLGLIEKKMSFGVFLLLNGKFKGKEYILNQKNLTFGSRYSNDIVLNAYTGIDEVHADVKIIKNEVKIYQHSSKNKVIVNDKVIQEHKLIIDDVIQIGNAKFIYRY